MYYYNFNDFEEKQLYKSSMESPIFFKVTGRDLTDTLVACEGVMSVTYEIDRYHTDIKEQATFRILQGKDKAQGRKIDLDEITNLKHIEESPELKELYKKTMDTIHCQIFVEAYPELDLDEDADVWDIIVH